MGEGDGKAVLVTGGTGYLGGWCIVELLRRGYRVRTTVRNASREHEVHAALDSEVGPLDESVWTGRSSPELTRYVQSKTIAEQTAWGLAGERDARERLAAVNPTVIIGPVLSDHTSASLEVIQRLLKGMPALPRLS